MKIIKLLAVILLLIGCSSQGEYSDSTSASQTTTPKVTTVATTTSSSTTPVTTTTTPITTTTKLITTSSVKSTTTTTMVENVGSDLLPATSDYIMRLIDEDESFYAYLGTTTCPHCKAYKPVVEQVLSITPNVNFFFVMLDTDTGSRQSELLDYLQLEYIPLTIRVVNGEVVNQYVGGMDANQLLEFMN